MVRERSNLLVVSGLMALLLGTTTAIAADAVARSAVNVRAGPGTSYARIGQLAAGETVDVRECTASGWCFVERSGPDGWVSANYLVSEDAEEEPEDEGGKEDCDVNVGIGLPGPSFTLECDDGSISLTLPVPPPPAPPAPPATWSTGPLDVPQTWMADLDAGSVGGTAGADIWYEAETATLKYLTPRNGARIAVGSGGGFAECSSLPLSTSRIPLSALPVGTYVCVRTDAGRISQIRINDFTGTTMQIGYTTWQL